MISTAPESIRPTWIILDDDAWFEGRKGVTGGWHESAQAWHYEGTLHFVAGPHRLGIRGVGYLPHIRAVAFVPVNAPPRTPAGFPYVRSRPCKPPARPERTLVCILAQTRAHALTWANFKRNVLDELHADLALAIGVDDQYDYTNPFWQHAQYRWAAPEYDDFGDGFDEAQRWLASAGGTVIKPWRQILRTGGNWLG